MTEQRLEDYRFRGAGFKNFERISASDFEVLKMIGPSNCQVDIKNNLNTAEVRQHLY
jgi:hypothetical protein